MMVIYKLINNTMIKTHLGAVRYNNKMDKIFAYYKLHSVSTKDGKSSYDTRYWKENKNGEIVKK